MQPAAFEYHRPTSLREALELLSGLEEARPLAGGHSLLPVMKMRLATPAALVDLGRVPELRGIRREGERVRIGATVVYSDVARDPAVWEGCPVLAETVRLIGDMQVRNRGTVGGSVAHADPAADLPTLLVALDASIEVAGGEGERSVPAREFFLGLFTTALRDGELVTAVTVPVLQAGTGAAYLKHPHPASRYAVVGAAAVVTLDGEAVSSADLAIGGVTGAPRLAEAVGEALKGKAPDGEAVAAAVAGLPEALEGAMGDAYASAEYRVHLATVLARRALADAARRARGPGA